MLLQIDHLTLTHRRDLRTLAEDVSFVLHEGDKAAVIGEEGNGKSTLLQWIYDPQQIDSYCQYSGKCTAEGTIGYLAQELSAEDMENSIYNYCSASENFHTLTPQELGDIARQLCFNLEEYFSEQPVGKLSGGEKLKLQLSRLLFDRPGILLLDEPSSDLDLPTLRWLENFINSYKGIILYISHDETLLERTANVILHLEHPREGKPPRCTVIRSGYRDYALRRESSIQNQTRQAKKEREEYDKKMEKFRRIQQSVKHAQNAVSRQDPGTGRLLKKKMHAVQSMGKRFQREASQMTALPEVEEEIFLRFAPEETPAAGKVILDLTLPELRAGNHVLAHNVRLFVRGGEKIGIIGKNGAGKTTLIRQLAEQLLHRRDLKVGYMPQNYSEELPGELTPVEYLAPSGRSEEITRARTFLGSIRFAKEEMFHAIGELSGGQKAKLLLTKFMLDGSNVLILDEPTRNFSPLSGPQVRRVLSSFPGVIISVSHDRKFLLEVCDKLYSLTDAGLIATDKFALENDSF